MKRTWTVYVPGHPPFIAVFMEGEIDAAQALKEMQLIWANCSVE